MSADGDNSKVMRSGLAVSRSFGDFLFNSAGVVCAPEIMKVSLCSQDAFIVLASDGVFSVMTSQEVVDFVVASQQQAKSAKEISTMVCTEANRRWIESDEGESDDITCIVVFLENTDEVRKTYTMHYFHNSPKLYLSSPLGRKLKNQTTWPLEKKKLQRTME